MTKARLGAFGPGEYHPASGSLKRCGDGYINGLVHVTTAIFYDDHSAIIQVRHALALFLAIRNDMDGHAFAGEQHRFHGIRQVVNVKDSDALNTRYLIKIVV